MDRIRVLPRGAGQPSDADAAIWVWPRPPEADALEHATRTMTLHDECRERFLAAEPIACVHRSTALLRARLVLLAP